MMSGVTAGIIWGVVILGLWWLGRRNSNKAKIAEDRPQQSYDVFTREFDCEIRARDLPAQLALDRTEGEDPRGDYEREPARREKAFAQAFSAARSKLPPRQVDLSGTAICFLLDMSGAMAPRLPALLGELRGVLEWSRENGAKSAALGFTTRGWRGGLPRKLWVEQGRPKYPGRLCALMHVTISNFDESDKQTDWNAVLRPDVLRENIDGEALLWAAAQVEKIEAERRLLVILSDGAPVDDSTIQANGVSFLTRGLSAAIDQIEDRTDLELHGVGLSYRVHEFYGSAHHIADGESLSNVIDTIFQAGEQP